MSELTDKLEGERRDAEVQLMGTVMYLVRVYKRDHLPTEMGFAMDALVEANDKCNLASEAYTAAREADFEAILGTEGMELIRKGAEK